MAFKQPSPGHDVTTKWTTSKTTVGQGYSAAIEATAINVGSFPETLNVTIFVNENPIQTQSVTLGSGVATTVYATWNTPGFAKGNCTISAYATPVPDEANTSDNLFSSGWVFVSIPGDINGDKKVDLKDVFAVGKAYGSVVGVSRYKPNLEINGDGKIDLKDYYTTCKNYGKSW